MADDDQETGAAAESATAEGASVRSQHVVFVLPYDWGVLPQLLRAPIDRLDPAAGTQLLVVVPDADTAVAAAQAAAELRASDAPLLVPVTRPERAARQLAGRPAPAVAGTPAALLALVRGSTLKLDGVRTLVLAWADEMLAADAGDDLDALLAEVPRDAARVLAAARVNHDVEALVERTMRRARRIEAVARPPAAVAVSYVTAAPASRPAALRRVLDELDPVTACVVVGDEASEREARATLRALGYAAPDVPAAPDAAETAAAVGDVLGAAAPAPPSPAGAVTVARAGAVPPHVSVAVLYDLPLDGDALARVAGASPAQIVALVQPRQLDALRALAGGPVTPLPTSDAARKGRRRDELLQHELRAELERGLPPRELAAFEALLAEFDGAEVAAVAVRLLERERARRQLVAAAPVAPAPAPGAAAPAAAFAPNRMTRLFMTVGARDNVRAGDIVGAISGEAGISSDRIGKIELRESFTLVEVAAADAERVLAKVNNIAIRGRRVTVRPERDAGGGGAERRGPPGDRGDRGPRGPRPEGRGDRPDRGPRGGFGRPGGAPRGDAGGEFRREPRGEPRPEGGPRGFREYDDRPVGERAEQRGEWAERAGRLRNARRGAPGAGDPPNASPHDPAHGDDAITES